MFKLQEELDSIEKEIKLENTPQEIKDAFKHIDSIPTNHYIEEWRSVKDFEDYKISSFGRLKNSKGRLLEGSLHTVGYLATNLTKDQTAYFKYIHILVAEAFLGYTPDKGVIVADHIDTDKTNNRLENLQVISHRSNLTKDRDNKTGFHGVAAISKNSYMAKIIYKGEVKCLGYYNTPEEAGKVYQEFLKTI